MGTTAWLPWVCGVKSRYVNSRVPQPHMSAWLKNWSDDMCRLLILSRQTPEGRSLGISHYSLVGLALHVYSAAAVPFQIMMQRILKFPAVIVIPCIGERVEYDGGAVGAATELQLERNRLLNTTLHRPGDREWIWLSQEKWGYPRHSGYWLTLYEKGTYCQDTWVQCILVMNSGAWLVRFRNMDIDQ